MGLEALKVGNGQGDLAHLSFLGKVSNVDVQLTATILCPVLRLFCSGRCTKPDAEYLAWPFLTEVAGKIEHANRFHGVVLSLVRLRTFDSVFAHLNNLGSC